MGRIARSLLGVTLLSIVATSRMEAQATYPDIEITGRLQEQFYYFGNDAYAADVGPQSNIFTRRARIEARGHVSEKVSLFIQPSFENGRGGLRLRDAYIDVRLNRSASASISPATLSRRATSAANHSCGIWPPSPM